MKSQVDEIQQDVQLVLDSMRPYINSMSRFRLSPSDGGLNLIFRSTLCRQFDALEVISHLIANRNGFSAGQLLRPACEEFIWTKYLMSIPRDASESLVRCCVAYEVLKALQAQDQSAGRLVTKSLGLLPYLEKMEKQEPKRREVLRTLGQELSWPQNFIKRGTVPSMRWLASKTDEMDTYHLIYHATSRFVHFSASELARGAWYDPSTGSATITYPQFRGLHGHLCLYWGVLLLFQTWNEIPEGIMGVFDEMDIAKITEAVDRISKAGRPPIISAEELQLPW